MRPKAKATVARLGIHCAPTRQVHFVDGLATGENGYQVLDENLESVRK